VRDWRIECFIGVVGDVLDVSLRKTRRGMLKELFKWRSTPSPCVLPLIQAIEVARIVSFGGIDNLLAHGIYLGNDMCWKCTVILRQIMFSDKYFRTRLYNSE